MLLKFDAVVLALVLLLFKELFAYEEAAAVGTRILSSRLLAATRKRNIVIFVFVFVVVVFVILSYFQVVCLLFLFHMYIFRE
jgi:hypothetical protein